MITLRLLKLFIFASVYHECRGEESVDQPDKHLAEFEGRSVKIQCKYKTASSQPDLFWYIQRANDFPKYILRRNKYGAEDTNPQFQERFHSKVSSESVHLTIKDVSECFAQTITPLQGRTQVTEGETVILSCKYDVSVQNLFWYRQYPGSGLEFLLLVVESSKKTVVYADPPIPRLDGNMNERFHSELSSNSVPLMIQDVCVSDSAVYYCALKPTVTKLKSNHIQKL
ncbi:hypothetical protein PO909_031091 [Leuciscus waleckii]